ncbi:MAG: DNA replication/repair protein RecF, partial [Candidatus Cloacimonadota bacterium]
MFLEEITLENFRNYDSRSLVFEKAGSFLCGKNGSGKTNLLESIYMLSYGKSFRSVNPEELLMFSKEHFVIKGSFNGTIKKEIEFRFFKGTRKILINDVEIESMKELIGNVALVLLSLNDINLVTGDPGVRRRFINAVLSLLFHDYLNDLLDYRKVLRQRNRILFLKKIGKRNSVSGIDGWTDELVHFGSRIIERRLSIMKELNDSASFYYSLFSPDKDLLSIEYTPSFQLDTDIARKFAENLEARASEELERGVTLSGPHRDEFAITINGLAARKFASEGEQRTCAISLKIAQASFLKSKTKNNPILLIDEAVAELDRMRKEKVLQSVIDIGQC